MPENCEICGKFVADYDVESTGEHSILCPACYDNLETCSCCNEKIGGKIYRSTLSFDYLCLSCSNYERDMLFDM